MILGWRPSEATLRAAVHAHVLRLLTPALQAEAVTLAPEYKEAPTPRHLSVRGQGKKRVGRAGGRRVKPHHSRRGTSLRRCLI